MACHRWHLDVPSHVAPSHGEPRGRSQANVRPGANVHLFTLETLRRQRTTAAKDRWQANDGWNEGEAREVQEQASARTNDHCSIPELADPQADRPSRTEARRRPCPQFAVASLLGRGELSPKHRAGNSWQLAFRCNVSAATRRRWQQQQR